jgi:hypothetical protein
MTRQENYAWGVRSRRALAAGAAGATPTPGGTGTGPGRQGATLTEVLVALLILSIGLVSLATLFPLATIRSAKAVQMTTAADMRYNAEAFLDRFPESLKTLNTNALVPPKYVPGIPFVIDPDLNDNRNPILEDKADSSGKQYRDYFGVQTRTSASAISVWPHIARLPAPDTASLASLAQSVDTFTTLYSLRLTGANAPAVTTTSFTLPATVHAELLRTAGAALQLQFVRLVFESRDGRAVQIRRPTQLTGTTFQWTQALPNDFLPSNTTSPKAALVARIESQQVRYTWLLAVRPIPNTDLFDVDAVSFFLRPRTMEPTATRDPYSEQLFQIWSYQRPNGSNGANGQMDTRFGLQAGQSQYVVVANGNDNPVIRKGSFLVDGENNRWYRIANVKEAFPAVGQWLVYLDRPVIESNKAVDANGAPTKNWVMFPRGVVDVYPLGVRK